MSIYKNAINSITMGVEDYNMVLDGDDKRLISSTRNIFAGILLLFKYKLSELSPEDSDEVLIKKDILPVMEDGISLIWKGKGSKTVDVEQIKRRFQSLGINIDWKRLDKINQYRNKIEHYYSTEDKESVKGMISSCFLVIRDFINNEIKLDPKEELGYEVWDTLVSISEVNEAEKMICMENLNQLDWIDEKTFRMVTEVSCDDCLSNLINSDENGDIYCKSCDKEFKQSELVEIALEDNYGLTPREVSKGEEPSIIECPNCNVTTYVLFENMCKVCGESMITECSTCGMTIPWEELDGSDTCGYCQYQLDKSMWKDD